MLKLYLKGDGMKTRVTELLGIDYPILQGAMAHISDPDLASAVSNAGGLGILDTGGANAEKIKEKVEEMLSKTEKPFAVNLYLMNPNIDSVVDYLLTSEVKIVTTGAGTPKKWMPMLKEVGIIVIPVVPTVRIAQKMEEIGADAVIVEGMEAGGHIGKLTTMAVVPQVVDAVDIPVIAAGGIADGRGMAAVMMLGAEGIQMGTRFLAAKETNIHQKFKDKVIQATDIETVITGNYVGHSVRLLRNQLTTDYISLEKELLASQSIDSSLLDTLTDGSLKRAVEEGDTTKGSMMAGQIAGLIREEKACREIISDVIEEFAETLNQFKTI